MIGNIPGNRAIKMSGGFDPAGSPAGVLDDGIRDMVMRVLKHSDWTRSTPIGVEVADGVVTLQGTVPSPAIRDAAGWIARQVPGVRSIINGLVVAAPRTHSGAGDAA